MGPENTQRQEHHPFETKIVANWNNGKEQEEKKWRKRHESKDNLTKWKENIQNKQENTWKTQKNKTKQGKKNKNRKKTSRLVLNDNIETA